MSGWHLHAGDAEAYRSNSLGDAAAASLEAHVVSCAACRGLLAGPADAHRLARNLAAVLDAVDATPRRPLERALGWLGVPDHVARLIAVTPAMRLGWLAALVLVSGLALVASSATPATQAQGAFWFLVLAPVLPVIGVAASFGKAADPAYELAVAAPVSALELLLLRATAVLATSTPVTALASLVLPGSDWTAAAWLLPSLGLTASTLALARWASLRQVAVGLSGAWLVAAVVAARYESAPRLIQEFPAFRPAGQAAFLALVLLATGSIVLTRNSFDLRRAS